MIIDTNRSNGQDVILALQGGLARLELGSAVLGSLLENKEVFLLEAGKVANAVRADMLEHDITSNS
ncbi:MAG: hypothetical protein HGA67_00840 [Candidatus Yonathbacteria bacterium]|nr:hypothetical protein [Candidatus Yonathbacteria bacterium]